MAFNITRKYSTKKMLFVLLLICVVSGNVTEEIANGSDVDDSSVTTDFYSSSMDTSIDDCNGSSCIAATPSTTINQIPTTTRPPKDHKKIQREPKFAACLCDLQINICDINCCCDSDCSFEKKKIFDHCILIENTHIDRRACEYVQYDYVNFSIHEWEVQNNDLFCVVRTNVPPSYTIQRNKPFINYEDTILEKNPRYDWPEEIGNHGQAASLVSLRKYIQGSPMWVILDNKNIEKFQVHEAFISSGCNVQVEVEFLRDRSSECVQIVNEKNKFLNADYFSKFVFLAKPSMFNSTKLKDNLTKCSSPACLIPNLELCSDFSLDHCTKTKLPKIALTCSNQNAVKKCENIVQSIKYKFSLGTIGINEITLSFFLKNVTFETNEYEIVQRTTVEFEWVGSEKSFANTLSGNPGYLLKKPILVGNSVNGTIHRMWDSYKEHFMVLPLEDEGLCRLGKNSYQPIEFRFNTILLCQIRGTILLTKNTKPIDTCKALQIEIFKYWNILELKGEFVNKTFGQFGNANSSIPDDWKNILYDTTPKHVLGNISGEFSNKNRTLICSKLILGMRVDIYHARVNLKTVVDQEKILGVTHRFQNAKNLTLIISNYTLAYDLDLDTKVAFWDVTSPKFRKLAATPSLNIRLPSDFFYPFVKVGNNAYGNSLNYSILMISFFILSK